MTDSRSARRHSTSTHLASTLAAALAIGASCNGAKAGDPQAAALHSTAMEQVPVAVAAGQAPLLAPLAETRHLKLAINLPLRNQAELDALLLRLQDPRSPDFHHYLGVDEFTARFAPTQADYDNVVSWAKAQGFVVTDTTRNRHIVDIDGSVDVIDRALHVTMGSYRHPTEKRTFFAPDREPTLDLGVAVTQITGLDNFTLPKPRLRQGSPSFEPGPVAHASGSGPGGQFLPSDMRAAYYGNGPLTGAGQTVGIFSFDGYKANDVQVYFQHTGMTSNVPINNVLVNGFSGLCGDGGSGCDDGEQILDIVNVIGMAPGIDQVIFYEGNSGPDTLNRMATDNLAKVLSCSWGSTDMGHVADPIFQEFQAQGQTFASATGDSGSYDAQAWLPPSLNSLILQVGGTDLVTTGGGGPWASETAWPDAGGGFYQPAGYSIPVWQQLAGVITATNAGSTTLRNDPDVSAEANFDNPTVSNGQFLTGYGGTSFAAPRWAGFIALANEQSIANGAGPLGFVNPAIYAIGTGANYPTDFHDPASGSNGAFHAVAGFDLVTGWGSPTGTSLVGSLSGSTSTPGFVLAAYPVLPYMLQNSTASTTIEVSALNGFSDTVDLAVSGLPSGVIAAFDNPSTTTGSTLTFTSTATAAIGTATVTITGTSGSLAQTTSVRLLIGHPASATVSSGLTFDHLVPLGLTDRLLEIANAADSVPLIYSATAYASSDGSCTGAVSWLTIAANAGTVSGGESAGADVNAKPSLAALTPGEYSAEICVTTSDTTQPQIVVPVSLTVVPGPATETIFLSGFETGETGGSDVGVVTFTIDQPVEQDQSGSALDLATGNYHTWNSTDVDNINPYDDGTGLQVYWYDDLVPTAFRHKVGGVVVSGNYAVLQSGALIGPTATFSNTVSPMTNWWPGVDGYIGIAFYNSQTHALNYGYIHMQTTAAQGFPAEVLDYGFDNTGAAITIP